MLASMSDMMPGLRANEPGKTWFGLPWWNWVIGAVVIGIGVLVVVGVVTQNAPEERDPNNSSEAIYQCESAIEKRLKAPTTAEFSSTATRDGDWTVTGTVDAENSFGAMIRSSYECTVRIDSDEQSAQVRIEHFE